MRGILIGAMVAMVAAAGSAFAGAPDAPCADCRVEVGAPPPCESYRAEGAPPHRVNPCGRVIHEDCPNPAAEFGLAVASTALNLVYTPVRLVFGVTGAALGGFSGWASGGDMRVAKGWWVNTTEGDYYIRPSHFDGTVRYRITGAVPEHPCPETYDEPLPASALESESEPVVVPEEAESPPISRRGG